MTILGHVVEPPLLSLLSSTNLPPTAAWTAHPASAPRVVPDTEPFSPKPTYVPSAAAAERGATADPVVQLASPRLATCYLQLGAGPSSIRGAGAEAGGHKLALGSRLAHLSMQVRRLGTREFAVEVGVHDARGVRGVIRLSTHKKAPSLHARDPPLLHLPLAFPADALTPWAEIALHLPTLLAPFAASRPTAPAPGSRATTDAQGRTEVARPAPARAQMPGTQWGGVDYVRIYANCRIRRVWLSEDGERTLDSLGRARKEWDLYAAAPL
ncbi:hypothetical protein Q5752_006879 [Cryptotrichosporon argae]